MGQFKPMDKMETTEPSVELKLKKGGQAHKKRMADGGVPMVAPRVAPVMASRARAMQRPRMALMAAPTAAGPMKKGGQAEGGKSDMAQDKAMIKKAFKQHDAQEHKGAKGTHLALKKGGKMHRMAAGGVADAGPDVPGGLLGGIEPTKTVPGATTGVRAPGYKKGGALKPAVNPNNKPSSAKQVKSFSTKTTGVANRSGFKKGGTVSASVANQYKNTKVHDGENMPAKKGTTKSIHQVPAGYKAGGHVMHSAMSMGGSCGHMPMKKGGNAKC